MKCFTLLLIVCCAVCGGLLSYGQSGLPYNQIKQNNTWIFGNGAGLDFNTATPTAMISNFTEVQGGASVSDVTGQLRMYAMLDTVWDRNGNVMPNAAGLLPAMPIGGQGENALSDASSLIVPFINDKNKYFVFSLSGFSASTLSAIPGSDPAAGRLFYSVVDMSLNGGLGDVVAGQKGIQIDSTLCDRLVAVKGGQCNIWVLAVKNNGTAIHAFEITANGINPTPVVSPCSVTASPTLNMAALFQLPASGQMRVSPDNQKLAIALSGVALDLSTFSFFGGGFQLYDFDNTTGIASNQLNILPVSVLLSFDQQTYNLCFSSDNTKLYLTHGLLLGLGLSQYDISSGNAATILATKTELNTTTIGWGNGLRLGPDDKVYVSGLDMSMLGLLPATTLHRIESPNLAGVAATLTLNAVPLLTGSNGFFSLGNATIDLPPSDSTFNSQTLAICAPQTSLNLSVPLDPGYTYLWDNGTTANTRTVTSAGTYWVMHGPYCPKMIDTFIVEDVDLRFDLGNDTVICGTIFPFNLKAPLVPGASYLWQDGSTAPAYQVTASGEYSVTVSRLDCTASDDIKVDAFDVFQDLGKDTSVCANTPFSIRLDARVPDGATVLWSTGATSPEIYVSEPGSYGVRVSQDVCTSTDTVKIRTELCDCLSFMPTAFSPNSDGLNDIFVPVFEQGCEVHGYNFNVFNRWGQKVFSTIVPGSGWDGTFKGVAADAGTYMFTISFEKGTHYKPYVLKGDVVLVR
jgi:gliding motility-associated-like protein